MAGSKERNNQRKATTQTQNGRKEMGRTTAAAKGRLLLIGGREDREGEAVLLRFLVEQIKGGKLVVATLASSLAQEQWEQYHRLFNRLGLKEVEHLTIGQRETLCDEHWCKVLDGAKAVFFTGGDQYRLTTRLGGTKAWERIEQIYRKGGIIAGTSAGAAALSEVMLSSGRGEEAYRSDAAPFLAPGLGLAKNMIVDQHFSERGRIRRLLHAVAQNPRLLGVGIDEDTAVLIEGETGFQVLGSGAVYIIDGRELTYSNISGEVPERTLSVFNVGLHVLSHHDQFDLLTRQPVLVSAVEADREERMAMLAE
jgi:cyanophycinase